MASVDSIVRKRSLEDLAGTQRKRFKTSELPLTSGQRSSIDALLHTFKKKGEFDALRKKVWAGFNDNDAKTTFTTALTDLAESEIDREPSLLSRDRGKAATLIEGAVDRSSIYKTVEASIDLLITEHLSHVEQAVRDIRRHEVGDEVAAEEERKGNRTEQDYEQEAEIRRQAREKIREEELEVQRQIEEENAKIKAEERRKKREVERQKEDEREKEKEREERRRLEREKELEEERRLNEEREREHEERRERRRREEREKERIRGREHEREYDRGRHRARDGRASPWGGEVTPRRINAVKPEKSMTPVPVPVVDEKALEEAALELLLKEGQELAAKSRQKPELERSESLEPPPRRGQLSKSKLGEPSPLKSAEGTKSPIKPDIKEEQVDKTERKPDSTPVANRPPTADHNEQGSSSLDRTTSNHHQDSMDIDKPPDHQENRQHSRSRSRTHHPTGRDSTTHPPSTDVKEAYKQAATRQREREAEAWKRAAHNHRPDSPNPHPKPQSRSRSPSTKDRERDRDPDKQKDSRRRRHSPSRSPLRRRKRERTRSRSPALPSRNSRRVARSRSRTPPLRKSYVERSRTPLRHHNTRRDARSKSPVEIDRYVPGGGGGGGRGRGNSVGRRRARSGEREREREREERHRYTEIDRYVPGGGEAEEGRGGRRRSRSRKRERSRSRSKGSRRYD